MGFANQHRNLALVMALQLAASPSGKAMLHDFESRGIDAEGNPPPRKQGRNAAKRTARARIYKGPSKTPKGMKGKP